MLVKRSNYVKVKKGILGVCSGTIKGIVITKKNVIYIKKEGEIKE